MRKDDGGRRKEGKRERRSSEVWFMFWVSHKSRKSIEGFGGVESGLGLGFNGRLGRDPGAHVPF